MSAGSSTTTNTTINNNRIHSGESTSSHTSQTHPITTSYNSRSTKQTMDSSQHFLLNGSYDEQEAQDSFKQAVMEWRNGVANNNNNNKPQQQLKRRTPKETKTVKQEHEQEHTHRDAFVGSDQNDLNYRRIGEMVHANHSLSYAERMRLLG